MERCRDHVRNSEWKLLGIAIIHHWSDDVHTYYSLVAQAVYVASAHIRCVKGSYNVFECVTCFDDSSDSESRCLGAQ
jgi:hypothetical protein